MGASPLRRLLLGIGSNVLGQLIFAGQPILLVPLFIRAWGAEGYGHWLGLTALVFYVGLLDLGGQCFIGNLLAMHWARGDLKAFGRVLSEGVSLSIGIVSGAIAGIGLLMGILTTLPFVWHGRPSPPGEDVWVLLCLTLSTLILIPFGVCMSVYRAAGMFVRGTMLSNAIRITEILGCAALLGMSVKPAVYATALLLATFVRIGVIVRDLRSRLPSAARITLSLANARQGRAHLKGSLAFWLISLAQALNQHGTLLIIGFVSGPGLVAAYATHRTAAGLVGYVSAILQAPLTPELSQLWARGRQRELQHVAILSLRIVLFLSSASAVILWFLLPVIYPTWIGRQLTFQPTLLALFLGQAVLASYWSTTAWTLLAANRHGVPAMWSVANALLTVGLAVYWAPRFGLRGVAAASLAGDVLCGLLTYPWAARRFLDVSLKRLVSPVALNVALLFPLGIGLLVTTACVDGWVRRAVVSLLLGLWLIPATRLNLAGTDLRRGRGLTLPRTADRLD